MAGLASRFWNLDNIPLYHTWGPTLAKILFPESPDLLPNRDYGDW